VCEYLLSRLIEPPHAGATRRAHGPEPWFTWANLVTCIRALVGVAIFAVAAILGSPTWNFVGLAVYWALDVADGCLARALAQETRLGAQLDILADRLLIVFFYFNHATWHPDIIVPLSLFLLQFAFLDHYLSNQFLRWPILSPNYFYRVDRRIWLLNWTTLAKTVNGMLMTVLLVFTHSVWLASSLALLLIGVKIYSIARLWSLPQPESLRGPARAAVGREPL
jgi:CDP-diacylglycerol---glycerol-3-phosphate 3-phosphatidyltransferase